MYSENKISLNLKFALALFFSFFSSLPLLCSESLLLPPYNTSSPAPKVCVTQITHHPSLDAIRKGISDQLAEEGFCSPHQLQWIYDNAQGSNVLAAQIAQKFASHHPNLLIAISTPSTQSLLRVATERNIPLLFAGVSDPIAAKITSPLEHASIAITGVADFPPIAKQLELIQSIVPQVKKIGVLYHLAEVNSSSQIHAMTQEAADHDLEILATGISKLSELSSATLSLLPRVDAFLLPLDNLVISGVEAVCKLCLQYKKPLFVSDDFSVQKGALAGLCYDQYKIGRQTGSLAARLLRNEPIQQLPIETPHVLKLHLNSETAQKINVLIPNEIDIVYNYSKGRP